MSQTGEIMKMEIRDKIFSSDLPIIRKILESSGFFYQDEVEIGMELAEETLKKGPELAYHFLFATYQNRMLGFTNYGKIPCTKHSWDLYWIAVDNDLRNQGTGKALLKEAEKRIKKNGGKRLYIETSSRDIYLPTREFYIRQNYQIDAVLKDFYGPLDDKYIFVKELN